MLLLLTACLSRSLDAPYVLATGLANPVQLDHGSVPATLVVTTASGWVQVDFEGKTTPSPLPAERRVPLRPDARFSTTIGEGIAWIDAAGALRVGERVVNPRIESPRALTHDGADRLLVVAGRDEPRLYRVEGERLVLVADFVGPVIDVAWGPGGALPERMLYLVREDGILEYLEPR